MCGINGIYSHNSAADYFPVIKRMNETLAHRGPDDQGIFIENEIALGHCRLSIIDLSKAGHQPMSYADGRFTIVFNGEIYNYKELREELAKPDTTGSGEIFLQLIKDGAGNVLTDSTGCLLFLYGMLIKKSFLLQETD
jgi:asparagine synthase (glutamine-hydrolysing)